jgi:hypothetical protein
MPYQANAPLPLGQGMQGSLRSQLWRIAAGFWRIIWQTFIPFNRLPEPPDDPPPAPHITDAQLEQCQKLYDESEEARNALEDKARATFTVIAFLVPLLGSVFVFIFGHSADNSRWRTAVLVLVGLAFVLLLIGFISIARAVSVQMRQTLGLAAIIDFNAGAFRAYSQEFHARGLLFCVSVNEAMNGHIAQFVKGAHILSAITVLVLAVAAIPAIGSLPTDGTPTKIQAVGSIDVASSALNDLNKGFDKLNTSLTAITNNRAQDQRLTALDAEVKELTASVMQLQDEIAQLRKGDNGQAGQAGHASHTGGAVKRHHHRR